MRKNELKELGYLDFKSNYDRKALVDNANHLKEDIQLMNLWAKRISTSGFGYTLIPFQGMCRNFYSKLYRDYYIYNQDEFEIMLTEYIVLNRLLDVVTHPDHFGVDMQKTHIIYNYFQKNYTMDIRDYVSDFIGCSQQCETAVAIITKHIGYYAITQNYKLTLYLDPQIKDRLGTRYLTLEVQAEDGTKAKEIGKQLIQPLLKDGVELSAEWYY